MTDVNGILVLDKPAGITSRDAVDCACAALGTREIGHCGTLDPLATGVLVLVLGHARRLQELLSRSRKVYSAEIRLGAVSATDDAEGPIEEQTVLGDPPSEEVVRRAIAAFQGEIEQRPPAFSAVKVEGKRLYALARRGERVEAPVRRVRVFEIEVESYEYPRVGVKIACAGGTYVRSIARDLGDALGTGGYLAALSRIECGGFSLAQAVSPDVVKVEHVLPLEQALSSYPRVDIAATQARRLLNGADVRVDLTASRLTDQDPLFAWVNGRAVAMLKKAGPQKVRSARLLVTPEVLQELAEAELRAEESAERPRRRDLGIEQGTW